MIIVKLMGGLGNQMFQYAAGRRLAWKLGTSLKLDLSFLEGEQIENTPRKYELDHFCIAAEKASGLEVGLMTGRGPTRFASVCARLIQKTVGHKVYRERWFHFDPHVTILSDNVYLEGYWQSEQYFADIGDIIRKELSVKSPLSEEALKFSKLIAGVNSVSLHVRRGDYVMDEKTKAMHGVCDLAYYRKAEDRVAQALKDPHFFVFSDDSEWVIDNLKLRHPATYVSHSGSVGYEDITLMSYCKHHVIANSSFSWWGAWLANGHNALVIAPHIWFNDDHLDTRDLIPKTWLLL